MKCYIFSDSHQFHNQLEIPECDMIIFCGDSTNSRDPTKNEKEEIEFLNWYSKQKAKYKIMIAGNHNVAIYKRLVDPRKWKGITYLEHESVNVEGLNIFGSPYSPQFGDWAFMYKRNRGEVIWSSIPDNTDILITHSMPKGVLDLAFDMDNRKNIVQVGCKCLANRIDEIKPKYFMGGHLHSEDTLNNRGIYSNGITTYVNASCLNHKNKIFHQGFLLDL